MSKFNMFWLLAPTLFAFAFLYVIQYLAVASPTARVLAAMRAKVVLYMARGLRGADAFLFALKNWEKTRTRKRRQSHGNKKESRGISMYHTWYRYWSTSNTLLFYTQ